MEVLYVIYNNYNIPLSILYRFKVSTITISIFTFSVIVALHQTLMFADSTAVS